MADRKLKVFLCHAVEDKPAVRELYQRLKSKTWIEPWLDEESLLPGQDFDVQIYKATRDTDAIIICLSKISVAKEGYVNKEIRHALDIAEEKPEGAIYVIPLRLDNCTPSFIGLQKLHWVDYFTPNAHEKLLNSLRIRAEVLKIDVSAEEKMRMEAEERARKELQERIDQEAREKIQREMEERLRKKAEACARAEFKAREKTEREARQLVAEQAAKEEAREVAEREKQRLAAEKAAKEEVEQGIRERVAREAAEREEVQRLANEKADKEKAEREVHDRAAREQAEQEAKRLASEKAAKEKTERIPSLGWRTVFWITLSWSICWSISFPICGVLSGYAISSPVCSVINSYAVGWVISPLIGGFITALILWREHVISDLKSIFGITLSWLIGEVFGMINSFVIPLAIYFTIGLASGLFGWTITITQNIYMPIFVMSCAISGATSGIITAFTLRNARVLSGWMSVLWIILSWSIGNAIIGAIHNAIIGAIIGALVGFVIILQIRKRLVF